MEVEIITPEKIVFQGQAGCIILPTKAGEISALDHHCSLISVLSPGKIRLKNGTEEMIFGVEGGLLEVSNGKVNILLKKF